MMSSKKLWIGILIIAMFLYYENTFAQNCKQGFYGATAHYNGGQFQSAIGLLDKCMEKLNTDNEDKVFKFSKLYIASCKQVRNCSLGNLKRKQLIDLYKDRPVWSEQKVIDKLNATPI